ncbi:uncharacterized protein [Littorina saxatilis]
MDGNITPNPGQSATGASGGQQTSDVQQNPDQAVADMTEGDSNRSADRNNSIGGDMRAVRARTAAPAGDNAASLQVIVAAFPTQKQMVIELRIGYSWDLTEMKDRAATFCCKELDPSTMANIPEIGAYFSFAGREYRSWKCASLLLQIVDLTKIKEGMVGRATWSIDIEETPDLLRCGVGLFKKGTQEKITDLALEVSSFG